MQPLRNVAVEGNSNVAGPSSAFPHQLVIMTLERPVNTVLEVIRSAKVCVD